MLHMCDEVPSLKGYCQAWKFAHSEDTPNRQHQHLPLVGGRREEMTVTSLHAFFLPASLLPFPFYVDDSFSELQVT